MVFFEQVKRYGDNFSYVVADEVGGEAMVVDPSFNADVLVELLRKRRLLEQGRLHEMEHMCPERVIGLDQEY